MDDEGKPTGVLNSDDCSFNQVSFYCAGGASMKVRDLRVADNFFSVAVDE